MAEKFGRLLRRGALGFDFDTDFEVESYLRYQGDKFSDLLRRQHLPAHHQGARLLRSRGRLRRRPDQGAGARQGRVPGRLVQVRLALHAGALARDRAGAARQPAHRLATPRSTRRAATTPSCWKTRATTARCAPTSRNIEPVSGRIHDRPIVRWVPQGRARARPGLRRRRAAALAVDRSARRRATAWRSTTTSVLACVANDVNVLQVDLESGLSLFADGSFDCVILSRPCRPSTAPSS